MAVTANSNNPLSQLDQVIDRNASPGQKWFSLQNNKLDGTFHPIKSNPNLIVQADLSSLHAWNNAAGNFNGATQQPDGFWRVLKTNGTNTAAEILMNNQYNIVGGHTYEENFLLRYDGTLSFAVTFFTNNGHHIVTPTVEYIGNGVYRARAQFTTATNDTYIRALDINTLAGSFTYIDFMDAHLLDVSEQIGFLGAVASDSTGTLPNPDILTWTFDEVTPFEAYKEDWNGSTVGHTVVATTVNSVANGKLNVTSTTNDAMIYMENIGSFDPTKYRFIEVKYKVTAGTAGGVQVYFENTLYTSANAAQCLNGSLVSDGNWHVLLIDGWSHANWKTQGNITGWRFDWCTASGVTMDIDYARLVADVTPKRSFNMLRIAGDSLLNEFPVDFDVVLYSANTVLLTQQVRGNASAQWTQILSSVQDATRMDLIVYKVNNPNHASRILEISDLWQLYATDAGTLSGVDAHTLVALSLHSQDAGTLSTVDIHKPLTVQNTRTDAGTLSATDSSFFTHLEKLRTDSLVLTQVETKAINNSFTRPDSGAMSITETHATTVTPTTRIDSGTMSVAESKNITNRNIRTDSLVVTQSETKTPPKVSFTRPDSLILTQSETKTPPKVNFKRTDSLVILDAETKRVTAKLYRQDTALFKQAIEGDDVTAEFSSGDSLVVALTEASYMTNIHTVMDGDYRQIYGKVEITYTDPLVDGDVTITASSTASGTDPSETADTKDTPDYKWFSLQENVLDGTYHPMDSDLANSSVGWWGTVLSDSTGALSPSEWLKADFSQRGVYELKVTGDSLLNEFPVDFDITIVDNTNTTVLTRQVRGNTLVAWSETLSSPVVDAISMTLTIYKVNKPSRTVKIVEFFANLVEVYESDDIISVNLLEEQNFTDMTLPIGNVSSNELEVRLYNDTRKFDADNDDSPLYGWLKKNRRVIAWLGAEVVPGQIEWYQLGVFWTQDWTVPDGDVYADVVAYDRLESIRVTDFTSSQVYVDKSLYDVATIILQDAGLRNEEFVVDDRLKNTVVPYIWFTRMSHRDAIVKVAEAALGRVYCDRQGRIVVTPYTITDYPIYDYDYDKSIIDLNRPVAIGQITNNVEVTAQPRVLQASSQVYVSTDSITLNPGEVYTETINFNDTPVMNVQAPVLTADTGVTVTAYTVYAWGMDVTYTNSNSTTSTIQQVTVNGQVLKVVGTRTAIAKDDLSIRDNGKQSYTLRNDFIQSYQLAQQIAQSILSTYSNLRHDANIQSRGNIALQLGDRITVPNKKGNKIEHIITRQNLNWEGSLEATVDAQLLVGG